MIDRLILWLALAGMILALHLWVQKARGFDQGCLGLEKPVAVESGDCAEVSALPASHLLGVSNAAWGYAFYFGLALLSFAKLLASPAWARRLHRIGEAAVAAALLYSAYLVWQMGAAQAWCFLCLGSATLVTVLFALHVAWRRRGGFQPVEAAARSTELGFAVGGLFAASGVLVAVLMLVNRIGTRPLDQGNTAREIEQLVGQSLPTFIDRDKLREMRACHFDESAPGLEAGKFIGPETPFLGKAGGIPVIAFFDPNCGYCRAYHPVFLQIVARCGDRARFYMVPRMLWEKSALQIEALKLAEPSGKYFEVWQRMFARMQPGGAAMTFPEIQSLFTELGLDTRDLAARLKAARADIEAMREREKAAGISAIPAVYIAGKRVWMANRSPECVEKLIDRQSDPVRAQRPGL